MSASSSRLRNDSNACDANIKLAAIWPHPEKERPRDMRSLMCPPFCGIVEEATEFCSGSVFFLILVDVIV